MAVDFEEKGIIWHPFTQHGLRGERVQVEHARGAYLYARDDGGRERRIIDAISSWWVITHGHCHPRSVEAVRVQAEKLDQVIFAGFSHAPAEALAEKLVNITPPALRHVFFSDSGSTAVEVALKMAIGYFAQSGKTRRKIIAFEGGYHGDTFGAMSAGARSVYNKIYESYLFDVIHIPCPVRGQEARSLEALRVIMQQHGDDVAAFIFEPLVLGAGGMLIVTPQALKALCDEVRRHGGLLIADEVMTGFGRTGTLFACEQAGIVPDLLCLSKGLTGGFLPLGVTMATREIYDAFYHESRAKMFFHSSSFTGNPMACAAACASLEIWEQEDVQGRLTQISKAHSQAALRFAARSDIENIRQCGTIFAFDVKDKAQGYLSDIQPKLYEFFMKRNLLLRPLGNTVYILPPYCVTQEDLDEIYDGISNTLDSFGDERK